jgi:type IV pilus assembly protein PilY1
MTLNTRAVNHSHDNAPARNWRTRPLTRVAVCLLSWWACGVSYAVEFPAFPLQTGVAQPAPNVIFIMDDSTSMTSNDGDNLDTGLVWSVQQVVGSHSTGDMPDSDAGAPYTRNALSYNPATTYQPWATANTSNTDLVRHPAANYNAAYTSLEFATAAKTSATTNLSSSPVAFYVPKPTATTAELTDQTKYYRYQIRNAGLRIVRAEWVSTAPQTISTTVASTWSNITGGEKYWGNTGNPTSGGGPNASCAATNFRYTVPSDGSVSRIVIETTGATGNNDNPDIYVRYGSNPCTGTHDARTDTSSTNDTLSIDEPTAGGVLYIGVYNNGSGTGDRTFANLTLTVKTSTDPLGCSTAASGTAGWKNCTDVTSGDATTGVRAVVAEKQNYANWYQYYRTRMKAAKAGGSEVFASLDQNYRVGVMGLYPDGSDAQILGGSMDKIIPVDNEGGLFVGTNRKSWFDLLQGIKAIKSTPLRQALNAAGAYFASDNAYRSTIDSETTYLACRQNFTILTTDGYWNNMDGVDPDGDYTHISGDEEEGFQVTGPDGELVKKDDGTPFLTYERQAPYWYNIKEAEDDTTLSDIAMHYWKTDLRTTDVSGYEGSATNVVPVSNDNPAFWQHMVTFGVGLGVKGKLTDTQLNHALAGTGTKDNGGYWPKPEHDTTGGFFTQNVDDLRHAALNGRGSYVNANNAAQFASGIKDALSRISERRGSASNVLANSTSISDDSFVYQATYTAGGWRGELLAYPVTSDGLEKPVWYASENIRAWGSRKIFTVGDSSGGSTFPNSTQLGDLAAPATALGLPNADALVDYLKGDSSREKRDDGSGVLRERQMPNRNEDTDPKTKDSKVPALMGDIVNSSPFYVADNQTVFVGANDGMLHAIDASSADVNAEKTSGGGTERFTYIPRGVAMSTLAELADPLYGTNEATKPHRYFVDGPIVVSSRARTPGKNYLVAGMGRGGRGVFGLDVTTPASFDADDVKWDNTGDLAPDNMGNVISEPLISKLNSGDTAAVVANGPNSKTETASLFIIDLVSGDVLKELNTGATGGNGLSAPRAVDVNADGLVDYFFAGDLQGTLWRFDVSSDDMDEWPVPVAVFTASAADNKAQAITSAPGVARDPSTGKIWAFFGTGRYITSDDQSNTDTQTYYGIVVATDPDTLSSGLIRSNLQERSIDVVEAETGRRAFEPAAAGIDADLYGWFVDLDNPSGTGERVISAPLLYDNILIFSSVVPASDDTVNSCSAGGTGYVNALDAFSGTSLTVPFFDLETPTIGDVPVGSLPIGTGMPTAPIIIGDQLVVGDSSGGEPTSTDVSAPGGSSKKRVSWRELIRQ